MEKVRQDAWSHEDDLLLAETVLRHIREGSTQLRAFEEVAKHLHRTAAACGFRWNAEIRDKYDQAIEIAKKQRKERKRAMANRISNSPSLPKEPEEKEKIYYETVENDRHKSANITLDMVITYLQNYKDSSLHSTFVKRENERLEKERQMLLKKRQELEKKLNKLQEQQVIIQEDYQSLIQIMDRARKMVIFEDSPQQSRNMMQPNNDSQALEQMAE